MRTLRLLMAFAGVTMPGALACDDNSPSGKDGSTSLQIEGKFDNCPAIKSIVVTPSEVPVGQSGAATVSATDKDSGDVLTFVWSAATGSFSSADQANSRYTCAEVGASILAIKVSDGRCDTHATVVVTCTDAL